MGNGPALWLPAATHVRGSQGLSAGSISATHVPHLRMEWVLFLDWEPLHLEAILLWLGCVPRHSAVVGHDAALGRDTHMSISSPSPQQLLPTASSGCSCLFPLFSVVLNPFHTLESNKILFRYGDL